MMFILGLSFQYPLYKYILKCYEYNREERYYLYIDQINLLDKIDRMKKQMNINEYIHIFDGFPSAMSNINYINNAIIFIDKNITSNDFIIYHELSHVKMNHHTKTMIFVLFCLFFYFYFDLYKHIYYELSFYLAFKYIFINIICLFMIKQLMRKHEIEADLMAAKYCNFEQLQRGIKFFKEIENIKNTFDYHPSNEERVKYLSEVLKQKEKDEI